MAQVAAQAEVEARRQLLAATDDPAAASRLASILRTLAEAAGAGAREGRARLAMELLAVESMAAGKPAVASASAPSAALTATETQPAAAPTPARAPQPKPAPEPSVTPGMRPELAAVAGRWAEVVDRAAPAIKPLLRECRPVALDGVRLTLAFPEERRFMREKASTRSAAIEQLLAEVLTGAWAVECITSNVELEPLSVAQAVADDPSDPDGQALLEGVLRVTGGELVDVPDVR
jgi:hypothetical protein